MTVGVPINFRPSLVSNHPFTRLDADLRGIPYHTNPQDQHTCLFLHAGDKFEQSEPELHSKLVHAMRSQVRVRVHLSCRFVVTHVQCWLLEHK